MPYGLRPVPMALLGRGQRTNSFSGSEFKWPSSSLELGSEVREREVVWTDFMRTHLTSNPSSSPYLLCDLGKIFQHL